jgi:hypothetical protein
MDYTTKLSSYYFKKSLIIRKLHEGRGTNKERLTATSASEDASDLTGRGGEIGIRARLRISWS